ncbi:MAG: TIGR02117 family protein [Fischerella sp. CENA71]|nr:TIGR02117 family protein [Fischerella sp. CENA71]
MNHTHSSVFIRLLYRLPCYILRLVLFSFILLAIKAFIPIKWHCYSQSNRDIKICVYNTGIHSNIIVPTTNNIFDWHKFFSISKIGIDTAPNYNYLSFGWGDKDFYMLTPSLSDLKFSTTFKALFLPTPSVMYVKGYQVIPTDLEVKCVRVSKNDYLRLTDYIQDSFQLDTKGRTVRLGNGHTVNAGFYAAVGSYSILRNCNSWTASGLRRANINTPVWDGLSSAIIFHLRNSCDFE